MKSSTARKRRGAVSTLGLLFAVLVSFWPRAAAAADGDDPLKPFPLLERGIVVGAGVGLHTVGLGNRPRPAVATPSAFAYLAIIPQYWFLGDITRKYCASIGEPQQAANAMAAKQTYPYWSDEEVRSKVYPETNAPSGDMAQPGFTPLEVEEIKRHTGGEKDRTKGWDVTQRARCGLTWLGVFGALPASYTTNVRIDDTTFSKEVRPVASFGVLLAPKPYFHVLAGLTVGHVAVGPSETARDKNTLSLFFGLGTTIDIVSGAFSK